MAWKPKIKRSARSTIEGELIALAVSLHQAGRTDFESGGWFEMRGAFASLAWTVGAWDAVLAPDHVNEEAKEAMFQHVVTEYVAKVMDEDEDDEDEDDEDEDDEDEDDEDEDDEAA